MPVPRVSGLFFPVSGCASGTARYGAFVADHVFRCTGDHDLTAADTTFRAEVNDPVGGLDDVEVVLDDDDGIAVIAHAVQYRQQLCDVMEVQAGGGLSSFSRIANYQLGDSHRDTSGSLKVLAMSRRDLDFHMLVQTIQYRYQSVNRKTPEICIPDS